MVVESEECRRKREIGKDQSPPPSSAESSDESQQDFDAILTSLGTGKWHALCYIFIAYWNTVLPYHTVAGAFLAPSVNFTCRPPPDAIKPTLSLPISAHNTTTDTYNTSTYAVDVPPSYDATCSYLSENPSTGIIEELPCTEWDFDNSTFTSTVTSEFALVCDRRYLRAAYQSIYMGGMMLGACANGFLADRFGRWTMIAIATTSYTVIALGSAWLPSMGLLLTARFFLGSMHPTSLVTGYILVTEITEMKKRSIMASLSLSAWSVGASLWGLWAYLERNWRYLQTYVSLFCPIFLPTLLFLKESPRWLVVMDRHEEALSVLKVAARLNGVTLPPTDHLLKIMKRVQEQTQSEAAARAKIPLKQRMINQVTILFSSKKMTTITLVVCVGYFCVAMVYFGLLLAATAFDVNPFLYVTISGVVELPGTFVIVLMELIGRKKTGIGCFALCAGTLLIQPLIPSNLKWLAMTLVMVGKLASTAAFSVMFLYASELYPTEIRTQGMSAGMISSRVGAFIAPFIMSALEPQNAWGIPVVFGFAAAVAALSFLPLWETKDTCLPDTVAELEANTVPLKPDQHSSKQNEVNSRADTSL